MEGASSQVLVPHTIEEHQNKRGQMAATRVEGFLVTKEPVLSRSCALLHPAALCRGGRVQSPTHTPPEPGRDGEPASDSLLEEMEGRVGASLGAPCHSPRAPEALCPSSHQLLGQPLPALPLWIPARSPGTHCRAVLLWGHSEHFNIKQMQSTARKTNISICLCLKFWLPNTKTTC